jgi:hypothetical protein
VSLIRDIVRTGQVTLEALKLRLGREDVELRITYAGGGCVVRARVGASWLEPVTVEEGVGLLDALVERAGTVVGDVNVRSAP